MFLVRGARAAGARLRQSNVPPDRLTIAMIGTRGVPAHYGGFETCVEEVGRRLVERGHRVVVYCRRPPGGAAQRPRISEYAGMELVDLPAIHRKSMETLSHSLLSIEHVRRHPVDVAVVFNSANAPWLRILRSGGIPAVTHVDGLESQRSKWGGLGRHYYRMAERMAVRWSDALIADAPGIAQYYSDRFCAPTELISYGAPIVFPSWTRLQELGLSQRGYHLVVARFEPENHVHLIVEGYCRSRATQPLVVVGSAPYADAYTKSVQSLADDRVRFTGGVWDQDLLDELYAGALTYYHGHSVGGTNPSLLRAMGAGAPCAAFDCVFNRDVLRESGRYFTCPDDVAGMVEEAESDASATAVLGDLARQRAQAFDWDDVATKYEHLCHKVSRSALLR